MASDDSLMPGGSSQRWRAEQPGRQGMTREVRILVNAFILAIIIGALIGIITWLFNADVKTLLICVPVTDYDDKELQALVLGKEDSIQLREQLKTAWDFDLNLDLDKYKSKDKLTSYFINEFDPSPPGKDNQKTNRNPANKNTFSPDVPVVIYLSGLGRQHNNQPYLLPTDFNADKPDTWIAFKWILETMQKHPSKSKLLLLDLAYPLAGIYDEPFRNDVSQAVDALLEQMIKDGSLTMPVLVSCSKGQTSQRLWLQRQSLFGFYLEQGLKGEARPAGALSITVNNLADYISSRVENWARQCLAAPQQPRLYMPARSQDFMLRKFLASQIDDKPAAQLPVATQTAAEKETAAKEKEAELAKNTRERLFPDTIRKVWEARDAWLQANDWMLAYPLLRQWERQILVAERCIQANVTPIAHPAVPLLTLPKLNVNWAIHHQQPVIGDDKDWKEQFPRIRDYLPKPKDVLKEQSWFEQAGHARKALLISQMLWNRLASAGTLTPDLFKATHDILKEVEQEEKKAGNTEGMQYLPSLELMVLRGISRQVTDHVYDQQAFTRHGENIKKMLKLLAQLETEVGQIMQDPLSLPLCQEGVRHAETSLYLAIELQFTTFYREESPAPVLAQLRQAETTLATLSQQRRTLQQYRQLYWESIRTLHASAEKVVFQPAAIDSWMKGAQATAALGNLLSKPAQWKDLASIPVSIDLRELTQPYLPDELKKRATSKYTITELFSELKGAELPTPFREDTLRMALKILDKENSEVRLADTRGKPPAQTPVPPVEAERADRRATIARLLRAMAGLPESTRLADLSNLHQEHLQKQAWFDAARIECLMPIGQVPPLDESALVVERLQANMQLADWLKTRLQSQQQLLAKFKIDSDFNSLYTRATSACDQFKTACQKMRK